MIGECEGPGVKGDPPIENEECVLKLYYFKDEHGNFGDDLNPWLWQNLFPDFFDQADEDLFIGVGTLLNHRIPPAPSICVFGSGHGYGSLPKITSDWTFYCVRGPLTASALGLNNELAITDPASLAPQFCIPEEKKTHAISFMPHCDSAHNGDWAQVCQLADIHFIDPRNHFIEVFSAIGQSELLVTEAMHGAILADSFRVPWIPIKAYNHISDFKWRDWLQSVRVNAELSSLPPIWRGDELLDAKTIWKNKVKRKLLNTVFWADDWQEPPPLKTSEHQIEQVVQELIKIAKTAPPRLSAEDVFNNNTARLMEKVYQFKNDFNI